MSTLTDEIQAENERFRVAVDARDLDAVMEYYGDDATLLSAGSPAHQGADAVRAYWAEVLTTGVHIQEATTVHHEERGDLLIEHGEYKLVANAPSGEQIQDTGKYLVIFRKDGEGRWRCWFDMSQSDSAAGTL